MKNNFEHYLRMDRMPHIWCPGCSHGIAMQALIRAIDDLELDHDKTVIVSGIGCSSRMPVYLDFNTLHTTHGRALAYATGVKMANPELDVIVISGDGDSTAIGGNHFIHACRRNIDLTLLLLNNNIYGMTGGQSSPTTFVGSKSTTAPYGHIDPSFDISALAQAAGASFVARSTGYHTTQMALMVKKGIKNKGFSLVEMFSDCPTYFGRRNRMPDPVDMLKWQRDVTFTKGEAKKMDPEEMEGKFLRGVIHEEPRQEYTEAYKEVIKKAGGDTNGK
jgi:2-oxoglutarate ferredoxin oxidoreductase subunit beta